MLEVRLLGEFEVLRDGRRITIPTRNAQSLFAYLVLNAGKAHRRERLAGLLWPDSSEENARSNLRHELWRLRKALETEGESCFLIDDLTIAFNSPSEYMLDVHRLESTSLERNTADGLIEALSAYQGELLPGFYDEWIFAERNRLSVLFETKITRLLEILQSEGRWTEMLEWGSRWAGMGGWPEPAYRALISAYANTGDISKAITTYERFTQALQKELGMKPSEQTQSLYKRLKTGWKSDLLVPPSKSSAESPAASSPLPRLRRSNLPKPLTDFIGREKEIRQVELLVSSARLITITGPGGVGKTRLAIQVAKAMVSHFRDGVWWVELAAHSETTSSMKQELSHGQGSQIPEGGTADVVGVALVAQAVAKALRVPDIPGSLLPEGIVDYLQDKQLLLILDNCEHLIEACAVLAEQVLGDCLEVTILVTSREALGVAGEKAWLLPSLSLPVRDSSLYLREIYQSEAVRLFIDRTADILPGYEMDDIESSTVAQICLRLDGIPLAIELAAARMNMLSAKEIAARLDNRFSLLTGGNRTALPRHQTLSAAIEWSHDLLNEDERILFRRLSIFAGSFTLEAAEAISVSQDIPGESVLTLLGKLVDKSLLIVEPAPHYPDLATRYRFLDTIRSFGRMKLEEAGETHQILEQQTSYYLHLVETGEPELLGSKQLVWLARLKAEYDNLRAVLQWIVDSHDAERALKLTGSLWRYWWMQSLHNEGREWLGMALSLAGPPLLPLRAKALNGAGILARGQGDYEKANVFLTECLEIQRNLDDKKGIANALNSLGILAHLQSDYASAINYHEDSLNCRRQIDDRRGIAASLHNLSMIHQEKGELSLAEELLEESLTLSLEMGDARNIAATQLSLGYIMYELEKVVKAEELFRKSMETLKVLDGRNDIAECLEGFAGVAALINQPQRGARLLAAAQAQRDVIGIPVARYHQARYQHIMESLTSQLDSQIFETYGVEGRAMSLEEAIVYALSGEG